MPEREEEIRDTLNEVTQDLMAGEKIPQQFWPPVKLTPATPTENP